MYPRKICVITGTRAEYGILAPLMKRLKSDNRVDLSIIATNMHLSAEYGMTVNEIESDGFVVTRKIDMLLASDTPTGTVKSMGLFSIGLADALQEITPDLIVILGDRYEMLAAASTALIFGIPVAHLHGGEITEGAYDDSIRHAITKLSWLHFTATEEYRNRVISMGEAPERVFFSGAPGADNIMNAVDIMSREELSRDLDFDLTLHYSVVTYHPVTLHPDEAKKQITELLTALEGIGNMRYIITMPNSDSGSREIAAIVRKWVADHPDRAIAVESLGRRRYYSALKYATAVIGNSSSGLCEAPSFGIPTLDIGDRQKGRTAGNTVIRCSGNSEKISEALSRMLDKTNLDYCRKEGINPYYKKDAVAFIHEKLLTEDIPHFPVKKFYETIGNNPGTGRE